MEVPKTKEMLLFVAFTTDWWKNFETGTISQMKLTYNCAAS